MRYIRDLEAAGFERGQAEAQVQVVLDAIEGELVTKSDFAIFQERYRNEFQQLEQRIDKRFVEFELRILTRLGFLMVSTTSIAVAVLTWLIKA